MDRMAIPWLLLMGLLAGCHGSTATVDPFAPYAPTKVAPPATGSARRTDPYYARSLATKPPGTVTSPGVVAPPLSPITRFTSDDARNRGVQMADSRAAAGPAAPATAGAGTSLNWQSPGDPAAAFAPPPASLPGQYGVIAPPAYLDPQTGQPLPAGSAPPAPNAAGAPVRY